MSRYAVFVDGGYFKHVINGFGGPRISYRKISDLAEVARGEERLRTYYYDCAPYVGANPSSEDKLRQANFDRFRKALEMEPRFQLRLGRLARYATPQGPQFVQKMVDILLTVDLVRMSVAQQIQRAVLIAGDSDYVPDIQVARDAGVVVQLYYCDKPKTPHAELLAACDERIRIDQAFMDRIKG